MRTDARGAGTAGRQENGEAGEAREARGGAEIPRSAVGSDLVGARPAAALDPVPDHFKEERIDAHSPAPRFFLEPGCGLAVQIAQTDVGHRESPIAPS